MCINRDIAISGYTAPSSPTILTYDKHMYGMTKRSIYVWFYLLWFNTACATGGLLVLTCLWYHLLKIVSVDHAPAFRISSMVTPALWALLVAADLVRPGLKTDTSMPASCITTLTHLEIVSLEAALMGLLTVRKSCFSVPRESNVRCKYVFYIMYSLQNSTRCIGGHSVHQWANLWWSGISFGGPKKYAVNNQKKTYY